MPVTVEIN